MQYMGGKFRIRKPIAAIVNAERKGRRFWDPFCGGLSIAAEIAKGGPGLVSDIHPALIALYQAVRDGWVPPTVVTREEHKAARDLPDTDPRKAFIGFGCSFGGIYFAGYVKNNLAQRQNFPRSTRNSLARDIPLLKDCQIACMSFFDIEPKPCDLVIYADPPYVNTTKYKAVESFDTGAFWKRVVEWEAVGVPVFVSEKTCPVPHKVIWVNDKKLMPGLRGNNNLKMPGVDKLFRVRV